MVARATRSASRAAQYEVSECVGSIVDEIQRRWIAGELLNDEGLRATRTSYDFAAQATGPLGSLSHDELGVIFDGLADPLRPIIAVALSGTCKGLRTPLRAVLQLLQHRHARAQAVCGKVETSCAVLREAKLLSSSSKRLDADDMATLGMILRTNGLPQLEGIELKGSGIDDEGMVALCDGLGRGAAPSLRKFDVGYPYAGGAPGYKNNIGPVGAEALAAALRRGAPPKLRALNLNGNPIGKQGMAALATPLRKLPALQTLSLANCDIDDEAVATLLANLGKDDFHELYSFSLGRNKITDVGASKLVAALDAGGMPELRTHVCGCVRACDCIRQWAEFYADVLIKGNPVSASALRAVRASLEKR